MKLKDYSALYIICALFVLSSCSPKRNLVYFGDIEQNAPFEMAIGNAHTPKVQIGDIMSITVSTLDAASNALFNTGALSNSAGQVAISNAAGSVNLGKDGYLVGSDGTINFPILGSPRLSRRHDGIRQERKCISDKRS